jgi:sterol desaturase/sphingolipid hydroxylase (fatty acid hydroxylase superfamily)
MQFHHAHYSGDHVISPHYLDNGDDNTLFFLAPVALVVGLSYFFLRLDLFLVQLAAMSLSFYGHVYVDKQYHVAGSWLSRFSWFRRKQQLHFIHHRHANCNFAVIDYFWDRLLGTYRGIEPTRQTAPRELLTTMEIGVGRHRGDHLQSRRPPCEAAGAGSIPTRQAK